MNGEQVIETTTKYIKTYIFKNINDTSVFNIYNKKFRYQMVNVFHQYMYLFVHNSFLHSNLFVHRNSCLKIIKMRTIIFATLVSDDICIY